MQSLDLLGFVFDNVLSVTPPMGQLRQIGLRVSLGPIRVLVKSLECPCKLEIFSHETCSEMGLARYKDLYHWPVLNDSQTTPQLLGA